jgi:CubicO group peptidase (beta-lactamase class C family)
MHSFVKRCRVYFPIPPENKPDTFHNNFFRFAAVVTILALGVGCARRDNAHDGVLTGDANAAVDALFASWDLPRSPGCALAVARNGTLVYSRGYGYANLDYDIPVTPQTMFDVASITKQFVAANLSMLVLEGRLSLDDNVRKWLPELPEYQSPITLRHMLHHTSGLRDYLNLFPLAGRDDYYPISHARILAMMSRQRALIFPPGERYLYSNTAYMLLAQVLERAGGKSLGEVTKARIFEPLGMNGSMMYDNREAIMPQRAIGYDRDDHGRVRMVHNYNFDVAGDGQLYSTVEDLLRWDNYLHGAVKPAIYPLMLTEGHLNNGDATGYAQGIELGSYRGLHTVEHSGSSWGFRSELVRFVEPGLSIAIACNSDSARPVELARRVADDFLADQLGPGNEDEANGADRQLAGETFAPPALTAEQLAAFAGAFYAPELEATYRFTVVDAGLVLRIEQELPLPVAPLADDRFGFEFQPQGWSEPEPVSLQFTRDRGGAVAGFSLSAGSERGIVFEKTSPGPLAGEGR